MIEGRQAWQVKSLLLVVVFFVIFSVFWAQDEAWGVSYPKNFNSNVLPSNPGTQANQWQIIKGGYIGGYPGGNVSSGYDASANVSYSQDNNVRMTKNVIGTGVENEFYMYLNIEPQVSWEEILQLNTIKISNNNRPLSPPNWPQGGSGNGAYFSPERTGSYQTPVDFVYYAMEGGKKIILARVTMYSNVNKVPNGGCGIGNPFLAPSGQSFYARNNFDLKVDGGNATAQIDISTVYRKFEFAVQKVKINTVQDRMGETIRPYPESLNYDGGSASIANNLLTWNLPTTDLGLLPYQMDGNGNVTPKAIERVMPNGKKAYYRENAYRLSYRFSLDVLDSKFREAPSSAPTNDTNASYAMQTNKSPGFDADKEKGGTVSYKNGSNGASATAHLNSPYIKGLRYDVKFKKVIKDSDVALPGITFQIKRVRQSTASYSENLQIQKQAVTNAQGEITFENLPWGYYEISETEVDTSLPLNAKYLKEVSLPRIMHAVDTVGNPHAAVGTVLQKSRIVDGNRYDFQSGGQAKKVENEVNVAKIRIKKTLLNADKAPSTVRNLKFPISSESLLKSQSQGNGNVIYYYPRLTDGELSVLNQNEALGNDEYVEYELIVPKEGALIRVKESIPQAYETSVVNKEIKVIKNSGSTEHGSIQHGKAESTLTLYPGNDLLIEVVNVPIGTLKIQKHIANYNNALSQDVFMIKVHSLRGEDIETAAVLKEDEISGTIMIREPTDLVVEEIVPKSYVLEGMTYSGTRAGTLTGGRITVNPGEDLIVHVNNRYQWKPYFHDFDTKGNRFAH